VLKQAFTSKVRFSHHGTYWHLDNVLVEPQPAQHPHPPLWIAAGNSRSIRKVAELGCSLLLDQFQSAAQIKERIDFYRSVLEAQGRSFDPQMVAVARNVYVAEGAADREAALVRQIAIHRRMVELSHRSDASNRSHILQYDTAAGSTEESALYGSAEAIVSGLGELHAAGVTQVLINSGGEKPIESLRRFARQVMPVMVAA
jgi:alkanesulfonate monooxygenase SsuD/methylene tetrahydromethanopterin reductase-like flavin-dependent oxidoreductase (luciferase family)